jgi:predicted porin
LSVRKRRLFTLKLSLRADVSYSHSVTSNTMTGGTYAANSVAAFTGGVPAVYYIAAQSMPDVSTNTLQLRLRVGYALSKASALRLNYAFSKLHTDDWVYATNQAANTSGTVMPIFETAPNYAVQVIGVSYVYSFQ